MAIATTQTSNKAAESAQLDQNLTLSLSHVREYEQARDESPEIDKSKGS